MQYVQLTLYKWFISSVWKDMHSNTIKQKYHLPAHVVVYKQYIYTMKFIYHFYFGFKTSQHVHKGIFSFQKAAIFFGVNFWKKIEKTSSDFVLLYFDNNSMMTGWCHISLAFNKFCKEYQTQFLKHLWNLQFIKVRIRIGYILSNDFWNKWGCIL